MARPFFITSAAGAVLVASMVAGLMVPDQAHALFGKKKKDETAQTQTSSEAQNPAQPAAPTTLLPVAPAVPGWVRASAEERQAVLRGDLLTQAAFFSNQFDHDPGDFEAGIYLSNALRALGRFPEAADAAQRVLMLSPDNSDALMAVGRAHLASGENAFFAIQPLQRVTELKPRDWQAFSLLGVAYEQSKRPDEAWAAWQRALQLSPDNPAVLSNMAMFYVTRGDLPNAEKLLRAAVTQPGSTMQVRQNLALVLGLQGNMPEAERLLRQDLPPEIADRNLAWLRQAMSPSARTWDSVKTGG